MPLLLFFFLPLTLALSRSSVCPIKLPQHPPPKVAPRIVNGDPLSPSLLPYIGAIFAPTELGLKFKCTASIISSTWLITAAHCLLDTDHKVLLGVSKTSLYEEGFIADIVKVEQHPEFFDLPQGAKYDIAVIQISPPAPEARFVKVNVNQDIPKTNSFVRVMGFGNVADGIISSLDHEARQVDVPVTSVKECKRAYEIDPVAQVCAGYVKKGGCDSCQGDSGGPMIQYDKQGNPVLVGVVSFGRGCAQPGFPGVYTRTAAFESFLDSTGAEFGKVTETEAVFDNALSPAVIVGIVFGALVAAVIVVFLTIFWMRRRGDKKRREQSRERRRRRQLQRMQEEKLEEGNNVECDKENEGGNGEEHVIVLNEEGEVEGCDGPEQVVERREHQGDLQVVCTEQDLKDDEGIR